MKLIWFSFFYVLVIFYYSGSFINLPYWGLVMVICMIKKL